MNNISNQELEQLVQKLDTFFEQGGGHMNIIKKDETINCACAVPTLLEDSDRKDD